MSIVSSPLVSRASRLATSLASFLLAFSAAAAGPSLTGDTSHPDHSFFVWKDKAELILKASGFQPGEKRPLSVAILDYNEATVATLDTKGGFTVDAKGAWEGRFALPTDRLGLFKVVAKSGDVGLPAMGSRLAGFMTYAVVHDPEAYPDVAFEDAFFGSYGSPYWFGMKLQFGRVSATPNLEAGRRQRAIAETNACRRVWSIVNAYPLMAPFAFPGMKGFYTPEALKWMEARKNGRHDCAKWFDDPEGIAHYQAALAKFMRAMREQTPPGMTKRIYELESELDLTFPNTVAAARVAKAAWEVLRKEDPEGVIGYPGISNIMHIPYHQKIFDEGILQYVGCFTLHPYTAFPPEPNGFLRNVRSIKRMIRDRVGHDILMAGTEGGYSVRGDRAGELAKLQGQMRVNLILLGEGFMSNYSFYGNDYGNDDDRCMDGDYGLRYNLQLGIPRFRYGPKKTSPRAIAPALAAATWLLDGKRPTACLEGIFGDTTLGYAYADRKDSVVIALWDFGVGGESAEAEIPVGRDAIVVADVMGNEKTVPAPGGTVKVKLSLEPVYVIGPDPALWGRKGTMAAKMAAESARRAAEREARIKLKVLEVEPDFTETDPALAVTVENRTDREQKVFVETRLPGAPEARHHVTAVIPAKTAQVVALPLKGFRPNPIDVLRLKTSAMLADGYRAAREDDVNFWRAERIAGDVAAWQPAARFDIGHRADGREQTTDPNDLSASFAFGWTDEFLVGDVEVTDNAHVNNRHGWFSWAGDSVQMGFAKKALEKLSENNLTDMAAQAPSEITFALTDTGPEVCRTVTFDPDRFPALTDGSGKIDPKEGPLAVTRTGTKTHYRFSVPWKFINIERPVAGQTVRIASFVNDRDPGTRRDATIKLFELKNSIPKGFGRIVLAKSAAKVADSPAPVRLEPAGTLGQSSADGEPPVSWTSCPWCVGDADGNVFLPGGWRVPAGKTRAVKVPKSVGGEVFGVDDELFLRTNDPAVLRRVTATEEGLVAGNVFVKFGNWRLKLAVVPKTAKGAFVEGLKVAGWDREKAQVLGWDAEGKPLGEILSLKGDPDAKDIGSIAFHPATGDLLCVIGWPKRLIRRFTRGGGEITNGAWPRKTLSFGLAQAGGALWSMGSGASEVRDTLADPSSVRHIGDGRASQTYAVAWGGKGWWLATSQGAYYCPAVQGGNILRRVGGLAGVRALGVSKGRVIACGGNPIYASWLDDRTDEPLLDGDNTCVGLRWGRDEISSVGLTKDGRFLLRDEKAKVTWCFDPKETEWVRRHHRMFKMKDPPPPGDPRRAKIGVCEAVAEAEAIVLKDAQGKTVASVPVKATALAAEGDWLVAYVPERSAIVKYRVR